MPVGVTPVRVVRQGWWFRAVYPEPQAAELMPVEVEEPAEPQPEPQPQQPWWAFGPWGWPVWRCFG